MVWKAWAALAASVLPGGALCTATRAGDPRHEVRFLAGYSPASPTVIGTTEGRRLWLAEVGYSYACGQGRDIAWGFRAGVMPAVVVRQPEQAILFRPAIPKHWVYGVGVTPVGIFAELARRRPVHPIFEANGGIVASAEPIPVRATDATGLNFLFDLGGGLRWRAVTVGYRFLHISNAGTTAFNPGLDNGVVYVSYSLLR